MRTVAAIPAFKCKTPARQVCWIKVYRSSQNKLCDRENSQKVGSSHLSRRFGPLVGANRDPRQRIGERPRQIDAMSRRCPPRQLKLDNVRRRLPTGNPAYHSRCMTLCFEQTGVRLLLYKCGRDGWMIKRPAA